MFQVIYMIKILFICHGNICRSPMAEFVFKHLVEKENLSDKFYITSSAVSNEELGNPIHYGTRGILREKGIPFSDHRAIKFTKADYDDYDYIIIMDRSNSRLINRIIGSDNPEKVHLFLSFAGLDRDIADPWYTGNFEETYRDVMKASEAFLEYLKENEL